MISRSSALPPWRQIAALLRGKIKSGELAPGDRLPSILALAAEYQVAPVTERKAIAALREEGLVETHSGWGTFVTGGAVP